MWNAFVALIKRLTRSQNARKRVRHPFPPPYSSATLAPPPFPSRPGTSIAIEHHFEGVHIANDRRSMSFMEHLRGAHWTSGQPCLSSLGVLQSEYQAWIALL